MKKGSVATCLRKERCWPVPVFRFVSFGIVEAYGIECRAAGDITEADADPFPLSHSVVFEDDCQFEYAAIGAATSLAGEVILSAANDFLSTATWVTDNPGWILASVRFCPYELNQLNF